MKTYYFLYSIPAAVAFWFGAQAGNHDATGTQEPGEAVPAVQETREIVLVTQDGEGAAPVVVRAAAGHPAMTLRTEVRSTGEPAVLAWHPQEPGAAAAPVEVQGYRAVVPGVAAIAGVPGAPPVAPTAQGSFTFAVSDVDGAHHIVADEATRKAFDRLQAAEDDDERGEARDELRDALSEQYDKYLDRQEKELKKMAAKLDELVSQLEKRRDAKDELVELKLKTMENDASGLGWPSAGPEFDRMMWRGPATMVAPAAPGGLGGLGGPGGMSGGRVRYFSNLTPPQHFKGVVETSPESGAIIIETSEATETNDTDEGGEAAAAEEDDADEADKAPEASEEKRVRVRRRR